MLYKQVNLFLAAALVILLLFSLPFYNTWLTKKIFNPLNPISLQVKHLDVEERKDFRYGHPYFVMKGLEKIIRSNNTQDPLVLSPPQSYFRFYEAGGFEMPEPAVFYYFTGLKSVTLSSPGMELANWAVIVKDHKAGLVKIKDKQYLYRMVGEFKQFK